jgi:hypothetical protein
VCERKHQKTKSGNQNDVSLHGLFSPWIQRFSRKPVFRQGRAQSSVFEDVGRTLRVTSARPEAGEPPFMHGAPLLISGG